MIGKLSGIIDSFGETFLLLDVSGVGYLVHASSKTLSGCGQKGDPLSLYIETQVREDAITLYGFKEKAEQDWFKLLTSVQGVGAKAGLAILSVCPPERLGIVIASQDKAGLTQADGVGPKLATRILTELKDKSQKIEISQSLAAQSQTNKAAPETGGVNMDAVSALVNLGYAQADAYSAVLKVQADNDNLQSMITAALKELSV